MSAVDAEIMRWNHLYTAEITVISSRSSHRRGSCFGIGAYSQNRVSSAHYTHHARRLVDDPFSMLISVPF